MPGQLVDGKWRTEADMTQAKQGGNPADGSYKRHESAFRNWITADGSSGFKAEPGRYHLYVSYACPWAHRTLIFRKLKGLENVISFSTVDAFLGEYGWSFGQEKTGPDTTDPLFGFDFLHQVYTKAKGDYSGRVVVPVLWDKQKETIVSNESSEIIRMLNSEFKDCGANQSAVDFYPESLRSEIDEINPVVYDNVNNGVYKSGFASSQTAYETAVTSLFSHLDMLEARLGKGKYLCGEQCTEADWRLFTTLLRFDPVYVGHFKCNLRRIVDYPNLSRYLQDLLQWPGIMETINMDHIKRHYYQSHKWINPTGIVPAGPKLPPPLSG